MSTKRKYPSKVKRVAFVLLITLLSPLVSGMLPGTDLGTSADEPPFEGNPSTSLQSALAAAISQRQAAGLPVPDVTFIEQPGRLSSFGAQSPPLGLDSAGETINTTIIYFEGPHEAGYDAWPAPEILGELAGDETTAFTTGDLTEQYRAGMENLIPGIWENIEFGQEAQQYTIVETTKISAPAENQSLAVNSLNATQETSGDILMGFTLPGPDIDYTIQYTFETCVGPYWWMPWQICAEWASIKAGVQFGFGFGLRLPASASLTGPDQVEPGSIANFTSSLTGEDWDEAKYKSYQVAEEHGNELVLRYAFWAGVDITILGEDVCPLEAYSIPCHTPDESYYDGSASFVTPFGQDATIPIPALPIVLFHIEKEDVLEFTASLTITPMLTGTQITASWEASGACWASGMLTYAEPAVPVYFGFAACNPLIGSNQVTVELSDFRYNFSQFKLQLGGLVEVVVVNMFTGTMETPIGPPIELGSIFDGVYLGGHKQCGLTITGSLPDIGFDIGCYDTGPQNKVSLAFTSIDTIPPVTTIYLPDPNANGWYDSDVTFSLRAGDSSTRVKVSEYSYDASTWTSYTEPVEVSLEGKTTVYYRSTDNAGNVEETHSQLIQIDKSLPKISGEPTTSANDHGWWNNDVGVLFTAEDDISCLDALASQLEFTVTTEGASQSVVGTAVDLAGNSVQATVEGINLDKTQPELTITSPLPQTYANTDSLSIVWTAADPLSGIDTQAGTLNGTSVANGQPFDLRLMPPGSYTVAVNALDNAGNSIEQSVNFSIETDFAGLIASVEYLCQAGWINSAGNCKSLISDLTNAQAAYARGRCNAAENTLNEVISALKEMNHKFVSQEAVDLSVANALFVIENLSCSVTVP